MTHRGPFQPRTFCDSVITAMRGGPIPPRPGASLGTGRAGRGSGAETQGCGSDTEGRSHRAPRPRAAAQTAPLSRGKAKLRLSPRAESIP